MVVRIANFPRLGTEMAEGFSPRTVVYKYLQNTYFFEFCLNAFAISTRSLLMKTSPPVSSIHLK